MDGLGIYVFEDMKKFPEMGKLCYFGNLVRLSYLTVVKARHFISQYPRG